MGRGVLDERDGDMDMGEVEVEVEVEMGVRVVERRSGNGGWSRWLSVSRKRRRRTLR